MTRLRNRAIRACIVLGIVVPGILLGRGLTVYAGSYHSISSFSGNCTDFAGDEAFNGNGGTQTFITWDANYIYLGWEGGGDASEQRVAAFDLDAGTNDGSNVSYSRVSFPGSGQPDYVVQFQNYNVNFATRNGSNFSNVSDPSGESNYFSGGNGAGCNGAKFVEVALPRSLFTGGSVSGLNPTDDLGVYSFFESTTSYVYGAMPQGHLVDNSGNAGDGSTPRTFTAMAYFAATDSGRSPNTYAQITANPDNGNIHWDGLFADQSPFFMSPTEPVQGGPLTIRFRSAHGDLTSLNLNWYDSGNPGNGWNNWLPMSLAGQDATGRYDIWQVDASTLLATGSTKYYRFQANQGNATTWYNALGATCGSGNQQSCQAPAYENFWVIPGFHTPTWTKNAIFYQIFPDRFRNGDPSNDIPFHSSTAMLPDANGQCPTGSYNYGAACAFTHNSWSELPTQPGHGVDFYGGDLAGINQEIDPYLKQTLGVNALYLNPIFESPSNHKYDTQDYYTVDPHFGTNTGSGAGSFTSLVGRAHSTADFSGDQRMSVMLDGVFNHTGDWNCWFNRPAFPCDVVGAYQSTSSPYYTWYKFLDSSGDYCAWSGFTSLPQLNYSTPGVRDQIYRAAGSVMRTYLSPPYNVDGWRLDVADNYSDLNNAPASNPCQIGVDNHAIWQEIRSYLKGNDASANGLQQFPNALLLAEYWQKPTDWLGGDQWDSVMNYNGFNVPVSEFFTGQNVHGEDYGQYLKPSDLAAWLTGTLADNNRSSQLAMLNSLTTHDTARFLYRACTSPAINAGTSACLESTTVPQAAYDKLKMATELQMTYVGMPSVYYGDEIGTTGGNDPDNRRTFDWNQADWNQGVFDTTRTLIRNREAHQAFSDGSFKVLLADDSNNTFAYGRFLLDPATIGAGAAPSDAGIVALNNDSSPHTVTLDAGQLSLTDGTTLTDVLSGATYTVSAGNVTLTLPANTGAVLVTGAPASVPPLATPNATLVLSAASDSGTSNSDGITNVNTPTFTGSSDLGATVTVYDGATVLGTAPVDSSGNWTFTVPTSEALAQGAHSITAAAENSGGTGPASTALRLVIDTSAPVISFSGLPASRQYTVDQNVSITCSVSDAYDLIVSQTCPSLSVPAYTLPVGPNVLNASATDQAGNTASSTASFSVIVTYDALINLTDRFCTDQGQAQSLDANLQAAQRADARGDHATAQHLLATYESKVSEQTGQTLTSDQATILRTLAGDLSSE